MVYNPMFEVPLPPAAPVAIILSYFQSQGSSDINFCKSLKKQIFIPPPLPSNFSPLGCDLLGYIKPQRIALLNIANPFDAGLAVVCTDPFLR